MNFASSPPPTMALNKPITSFFSLLIDCAVSFTPRCICLSVLSDDSRMRFWPSTISFSPFLWPEGSRPNSTIRLSIIVGTASVLRLVQNPAVVALHRNNFEHVIKVMDSIDRLQLDQGRFPRRDARGDVARKVFNFGEGFAKSGFGSASFNLASH